MTYNPGADGKNIMSMTDAQLVDYLTRLQDDPTIIGIHVVDEPTNPVGIRTRLPDHQAERTVRTPQFPAFLCNLGV